MAQQNAVINGQLTFIGSLAQQASIAAQALGGNLLLLLPNGTGLNSGSLLAAIAVNGNTVTLGFVPPTSESINTDQLASVEGNGGKVQLTTGAAPASPVTTQLGVAANYAILAYSGITNTGASVITGGNIGSAPTPGPQAGFTFTAPAVIDNAGAGAARTAGNAAFTYYSGLTPTLSGLSNLSTSGNGANNHTYIPGVYVGASSLDIPTSITLDAQGNPGAVFVFFSPSSTITLESGASILLAGGAQAANVVWCVGSSFTQIGNNNTMVGVILAYTSITLDGGTLNGRALAVGGGNGAVTIAAAEAITATAGTGAITAGDVVVYDAFGNVIDSGIQLSSLGGAAGVTSFNGRSGVVVPLTGDYAAFYAPIASSPSIAASMTFSNTTVVHTISVTPAAPTLYAVYVSLEAAVIAAGAGHEILATITYTSTATGNPVHTDVVTCHLDVSSEVDEVVHLVLANTGTPVSVTTSYVVGTVDPYTVAARIVAL